MQRKNSCTHGNGCRSGRGSSNKESSSVPEPGQSTSAGGSSSGSQSAPDRHSSSSSRGRRVSGNGGSVRRIKIRVCPITTGGQHLEVNVYPHETIRGLKQVLARKYKLHPARISIMFKERVLKDGTLQDNDITDGSRLVLCPNMESGTMANSAENSVIQALRNLSDTQIHNFLTGKTHLRLVMRLNEHLMVVQLQLSAPTPVKTSTATPTANDVAPSPSTSSPLASAASSLPTPPASPTEKQSFEVPSISPDSLLHASQNLSQRIKEITQLSQSLQGQEERPSLPLTPPPSPPPTPGAVIENMQHLGKGIYSGTFSGMLDPRLQDTSGHPRRDINTIMHILHDLLNAQPVPNAPASHANVPPHSPSPGQEGGEEAALRDKMQRVQHMLEVRRQRRAARRDNQRPYPMSSSCPSSVSPSSLSTSPLSHSAANASHAESAETSTYRKPNIEQETVAV